MTISDRYREVTRDVETFLAELREQGVDEIQGPRKVARALSTLQELFERVGEIPRMRLEAELTPVLISAHKQLDWARLLFEEGGDQARAAIAWELEQKVYRLLNDL
jgi:hypothetical protein